LSIQSKEGEKKSTIPPSYYQLKQLSFLHASFIPKQNDPFYFLSETKELSFYTRKTTLYKIFLKEEKESKRPGARVICVSK
jgi:hypothetical protein